MKAVANLQSEEFFTMRCITIGVGSLILGLCLTVQAETIIHAGRLIDGHSDNGHEAMSLVIDHGRIVAVR